MRVVVRSVSWVLAVAVVVTVAVSWFMPAPDLDADDATDVAVESLQAAGVDATVSEPPTRDTHETGAGEVVDVWTVFAEVEVEDGTETVELRVQESAGRLVFIDDRIGEDDTKRLLDDREFERVGAYDDGSLTERWMLENGLGSAGAVVIAAVCITLARRTDTLWGPS